MKIDLLPRGQNPLSYYALCKHNILAYQGKANKDFTGIRALCQAESSSTGFPIPRTPTHKGFTWCKNCLDFFFYEFPHDTQWVPHWIPVGYHKKTSKKCWRSF
jgi:hypothetical protein